jgi:hypothetical protein
MNHIYTTTCSVFIGLEKNLINDVPAGEKQ